MSEQKTDSQLFTGLDGLASLWDCWNPNPYATEWPSDEELKKMAVGHQNNIIKAKKEEGLIEYNISNVYLSFLKRKISQEIPAIKFGIPNKYFEVTWDRWEFIDHILDKTPSIISNKPMTMSLRWDRDAIDFISLEKTKMHKRATELIDEAIKLLKELPNRGNYIAELATHYHPIYAQIITTFKCTTQETDKIIEARTVCIVVP